jgi:hypothetical protein
LAWLNHFSGNNIGVDDDNALVSEIRAGSAFATAYATGKAENKHTD